MTSFQPGECLGGTFEICGTLGRGGMAQVFEAEDLLLRRRVAIKVMNELPGADQILRNEAQALAAVQHHGVPQVYGLGVQGRVPYLILERLYGVTLEEHLRLRRIGSAHAWFRVDEALPILIGLAEALVAVHAAGVAHRDLKPGNVMLCAENRVVLLDFGIMLPEVDAGVVKLCGTPRYMAPEAIGGTLEPGRAHLVDLYAFGAIACELLTGRAPFEGENFVVILEKHLTQPPPDLGTVPPMLADLIRSCLAKNPVERPESLEAVLWDLRAAARWLSVVEKASVGRTASGSRRATAPQWANSPGGVLVVEDDIDIREQLVEIFEARGFQTWSAGNGKEALDLIQQRGIKPAVIVLDLLMPVMDGGEFLEHQLADPVLSGVPVVVLTAQPRKAEALPGPVSKVLPKPLTLPTLIRSIQDACNGVVARR
jgi:serine/threonine protein kinase